MIASRVANQITAFAIVYYSTIPLITIHEENTKEIYILNICPSIYMNYIYHVIYIYLIKYGRFSSIIKYDKTFASDLYLTCNSRV